MNMSAYRARRFLNLVRIQVGCKRQFKPCGRRYFVTKF